ncbi:MAG: YchJ family metal-binding protein, partial [Gammaproteobacteria bacterium]|nr:YchJ family metal-binding protein [Gammaproteobacteria bacterium]
MSSDKCPCGSGKKYSECCQPIIEGDKLAETAEALMRSRYSAYVKNDFEHVYNSYHPDTKQHFTLDAIKEQADEIKWVGLSVVETEQGQADDSEGYVTFSAQYQMNGQTHYLNEKSHFVKVDGRWLYVNGQTKFTSTAVSNKVGRNEPCP